MCYFITAPGTNLIKKFIPYCSVPTSTWLSFEHHFFLLSKKLLTLRSVDLLQWDQHCCPSICLWNLFCISRDSKVEKHETLSSRRSNTYDFWIRFLTEPKPFEHVISTKAMGEKKRGISGDKDFGVNWRNGLIWLNKPYCVYTPWEC